MNSVEDFMSMLAGQTAPLSSKKVAATTNQRAVDKIYLNHPSNFGRYQIFTLNTELNPIYPFVKLFNTREICIPRKNVGPDGVEKEYKAWIKILPKDAYQMKDQTGRVTSSLTAEEESLLMSAYSLFDQLYEEINPKENQANQLIAKDLLRKRNYTIFHGYCINKWDFDDNRAPSRCNFGGLFVVTAAGFLSSVEDNIKEKALTNGNDQSFVSDIYTNKLDHRDGYIMVSINKKPEGGIGFNVTVSHEFGRSRALENFVIPKEDAELMKDPVASFLGWQAKKDDENEFGKKHLFNAYLIKEAIQFITNQLNAIRAAKASGSDIAQAIIDTNQLALKDSDVTNSAGNLTNDPMLASVTQNSNSGINAERIISQNTQPYQTPPAAHMSPISGAPVGGNNGGFNNGFGSSSGNQFTSPFSNNSGFGGNEDVNDLPF